jgi:tRNA G46 methylase TrmB
MFGNSEAVNSNQDGLHPALEKTVRRHSERAWRAPVADYDRAAFQQAIAWVGEQGAGRPMIFDSGCGTARSSVALARRHPEALVLGLDQSSHRLERAARRFTPLPENLLLLRTDCGGFWRLAREAGWRLHAHYLLYPNPWPKSAHLKRRWHGHPVFPTLLDLGGTLVLRSNWEIYPAEMQQALALAGVCKAQLRPLVPDQAPLTDFEDKYRHSGHALWELVADLDQR